MQFPLSYNCVFSTKNENILIFHTGLGGHNGFVEFPDDGLDTFLYANELERTFKQLYNRKLYKHVTYLIDFIIVQCI